MACGLPAIGQALVPEPATPATSEPSRFRGDDGWLDISDFIDQAYGFVPLVIPIAELAVGYGGPGAQIFIDKQKDSDKSGFGRPNISAVGALGTDSGTRGAFAGDVRHWLEDRLKTVSAAFRASVNLDFYGTGRDPTLQHNPRSYNLETTAGVVQASYRFGDSQAWAGLGYALANTTVSFDLSPVFERAPDFQRDSRVGGLLPTLRYGDVPFYLRPFILLRGIPAMRFQGDCAAQVEPKLRWQFCERCSLVGFAGTGIARNAPQRVNRDQQASSGGLGSRYEIARKCGLHMGIDLAYGPDGPAFYVQFNSG